MISSLSTRAKKPPGAVPGGGPPAHCLLLAVICTGLAAEAAEEAIPDSLFTATTTVGFRGTAPALPVERLLELARSD